METATLLNIKATANRNSNHRTDTVIGQSLAMISSEKPSSNKDKADGFKSTFKDQVNKKTKADNSEKALPQNGNDLPKKDSAADTDKKEISHSQVKTQEQSQNDEQGKKTASDGRHEQNNQQGVSSSENEQTQSQGAEITTVQEVDTEDNLSHEELKTIQPIFSEYPAFTVNPEGVKSDQKSYSELTNGQPGLAQQPSLTSKSVTQIEAGNSGLANDSNSNKRNESALGKSITEFQQYIEISKKHSAAGESISSVKLFEQNIKNDLITTSFNVNEMKLPASQNLNHNTSLSQAILTTPAQAISVDKMNTSLNNTLFSFSKSMVVLDVKSPVGKAGWNQNFSNQILMMASNGVQHAKIKLNPMSLGPVEAMVKLSGESAVVNLSSLHLTTKEALENAIPRLKEMLNENGFSHVDVNVSHQDKKEQQDAGLDSKTSSNNEHGNSTMPGEEQLSEEPTDSDSAAQAADLDEQGLKIVDYYA